MHIREGKFASWSGNTETSPDVTLLSTIHNPEILEIEKRGDSKKKKKMFKVVKDNNNSKGVIDRVDQHLTTLSWKSEGRNIIIKCFFTF